MSVAARILGRMDSRVPPSLRRVIAEQAGVASRNMIGAAQLKAAATTGATLRYGWSEIDRAARETADQVAAPGLPSSWPRPESAYRPLQGL